MRTHRLSGLVGLLVLAGCSAGPSGIVSTGEVVDPIDPGTWGTDRLIDWAIEQAVADDADEWQIEALETARDAGGVTFDQHREGLTRVRECMVNAGLQDSEPFEYNVRGMRYLGLATIEGPEGMDNEAAFAIYARCSSNFDFYLNDVYALQPVSRDLLIAAIDQNQVYLRQCLSEVGEADAPDMTLGELKVALFLHAHDIGDRDCMDEIGIGW